MTFNNKKFSCTKSRILAIAAIAIITFISAHASQAKVTTSSSLAYTLPDSLSDYYPIGAFEGSDNVNGLQRQAYLEINITAPIVPDFSQTFKQGELHPFRFLPDDFMKKPSKHFKGQKATGFIRFKSKSLLSNTETCRLHSPVRTKFGWELKWDSDFSLNSGKCELHINEDGTMFFIGLGGLADGTDSDSLVLNKSGLKHGTDYFQKKQSKNIIENQPTKPVVPQQVPTKPATQQPKGNKTAPANRPETPNIDRSDIIGNQPTKPATPQQAPTKPTTQQPQGNKTAPANRPETPNIDRSNYKGLHMMSLTYMDADSKKLSCPSTEKWAGIFGGAFNIASLQGHAIQKKYLCILNLRPKGTYPQADKFMNEFRNSHGAIVLNNSDPQYMHAHFIAQVLDIRGDSAEVITYCERSGQQDLLLLVRKGNTCSIGNAKMLKQGSGRPCNLCNPEGKKRLLKKYANAIETAKVIYKLQMASILQKHLNAGLFVNFAGDGVMGITPYTESNKVQINLSVRHSSLTFVYHMMLQETDNGWKFIPEQSGYHRKGNEKVSTYDEWQ